MSAGVSEFVIVVPGQMKGKGRPRAAAIGGKARMFTPKDTVNAEAHVKACCFEQIGQPMLQGHVTLDVLIGVSVAASWPKKRQAAALSGELRPTSKPDIDNCVKLICDALNGIAWRDDSQVVGMRVRKFYADKPSTTITISGAA